MIAFSTISQISYMFLAIYTALTLVPLFHIAIHAVFKSLLFLLSGSLIHVQSNFQSIYKQKINHSFLNIIFILAGSVLIVSLSKEGIIHSTYCILSSFFVTIITISGGIFTAIYTLKIYTCIHYANCKKLSGVNEVNGAKSLQPQRRIIQLIKRAFQKRDLY